MKFHSGTPSGTAVSGLEMVNFLAITKRGRTDKDGFYRVKKASWLRRRCNGEL
jgi:hypothetical protein